MIIIIMHISYYYITNQKKTPSEGLPQNLF